MLFNNRDYPHPVLGIAEDYKNSVISVSLNISTKLDSFEIRPIFYLKNIEIQHLLDNQQAEFITQIYCRGTMYRDIIKSGKNINDPILIPSTKLNGEVELDFFIVVNKNILDFISLDFSPVFDRTKFNINDSEIIAYGGQAKFFANKAFTESIGLSSLINVTCNNKSNKPLKIDYSGERISIVLCKEDFDKYKLLKSNPQCWPLILTAIVFPALIEILHFIDSDEAEEFTDKYWYDYLTQVKNNNAGESTIVIAQNILDKPLTKLLEFESNEY